MTGRGDDDGVGAAADEDRATGLPGGQVDGGDRASWSATQAVAPSAVMASASARWPTARGKPALKLVRFSGTRSVPVVTQAVGAPRRSGGGHGQAGGADADGNGGTGERGWPG